MLPFVIVKSSGYLETVQRGVADFPEEPMLRWYLEGLISLDQAGMVDVSRMCQARELGLCIQHGAMAR